MDANEPWWARPATIAAVLAAVVGVGGGFLSGFYNASAPQPRVVKTSLQELGYQQNLTEEEAACFGATGLSRQEVALKYESEVLLHQDQSRRYTVEIQETAPSTSADPTVPHLRIVCTVEAQLVAPASLQVSPEGWLERQHLGETSTWNWSVTATGVEDAEATLELRPVVRLRMGDGPPLKENLETEPFPVTFSVDRTFGQWLTTTQGSITAGATSITAVLTAGTGLWALSRSKGKKQQQQQKKKKKKKKPKTRV